MVGSCRPKQDDGVPEMRKDQGKMGRSGSKAPCHDLHGILFSMTMKITLAAPPK